MSKNILNSQHKLVCSHKPLHLHLSMIVAKHGTLDHFITIIMDELMIAKLIFINLIK